MIKEGIMVLYKILRDPYFGLNFRHTLRNDAMTFPLLETKGINKTTKLFLKQNGPRNPSLSSNMSANIH
jgi:hypothetical protein